MNEGDSERPNKDLSTGNKNQPTGNTDSSSGNEGLPSETQDLSFEDKIEELDSLLIKNKNKWQLTSIAWLDYNDICQIIRIHIHKKWHLWDQSRPFQPWANTIISNQITNQIRNHFGNFAKPCLKCPYNMGDFGEHCYKTPSGKQCRECPLYAQWEKRKKKAYNVKLPVSLSEVSPKGRSSQHDNFCYDKASYKLHKLVMQRLKSQRHKRIYYMLYVEHLSHETIAKEMGFKADTKKRKNARYKQISNLQKKFKQIAKDIVSSGEDLFL